MDPSSSSSPEEQEAHREGGRPCCIYPLHHLFYEPWRKHSRLSICCGHAVPRHKLERQCSSTLERVEWTRLGSWIWTHRTLHQKSKRPTAKADGPAALNLAWQRSPRTEAGRLPLRLPLRAGCRVSACSKFFLTDLRKHSRTQDVAVASSLSKVCLATSRNSGFVQRGVFFRSFSAMIEVFSSFPSPGRQTRVYPPTMTLCAEGFTRGSLGPLEWPNGPEV